MASSTFTQLLSSELCGSTASISGSSVWTGDTVLPVVLVGVKGVDGDGGRREGGEGGNVFFSLLFQSRSVERRKLSTARTSGRRFAARKHARTWV